MAQRVVHFRDIASTAHTVPMEGGRRAYFNYRNDRNSFHISPSMATFVDAMPSQSLQPHRLTIETDRIALYEPCLHDFVSVHPSGCI